MALCMSRVIFSARLVSAVNEFARAHTRLSDGPLLFRSGLWVLLTIPYFMIVFLAAARFITGRLCVWV